MAIRRFPRVIRRGAPSSRTALRKRMYALGGPGFAAGPPIPCSGSGIMGI